MVTGGAAPAASQPPPMPLAASRLPRLMIAAPATGQGKTTISAGLMAALSARGLAVSGHKAGPDYIDPGYHALATGRPGRNLDPHLVGEERIAPLLLHGARGAGVAVIEGVMGLHDGRIGAGGFASSAHVATLTRTPVVLVIDISRASRSAAAIALGMAAFDPAVQVAGVILNQAGSARNAAEVERSMRLPVLGVVPRDEALSAPSRHLGLVPAAERDESRDAIARLGEQVARHVDIGAVLDLARSAPPLAAAPWDPVQEAGLPGCGASGDSPSGEGPSGEGPSGDSQSGDSRSGDSRSGEGPAGGMPARAQPADVLRPVVAVAGGRAFTFRYAETDELLAAAGCAVVPFDPLTDSALPAGTRGIYLGGGFPEVYADELAANRALLRDVRAAAAGGVPVIAECAGLLYLAQSVDGMPMAGVLPASAAMTGQLTLRYPEAIAVRDSIVTRAGERVTGHEFHRTQAAPPGDAAWEIDGVASGFATPTLHASYLHVHWAGHPQLAQRFARAAGATQAAA
jgi:cobyrinic acid a,c-diamide synthase